MNLEDLRVTVPRKNGFGESTDAQVWPLVERTLQKLEADEIALDAARKAMLTSQGCLAVANYLISESERFPRMDYSFRAPLLILAVKHAENDSGADLIYDEVEAMAYFETDDYLYGFLVMKEWSVDWASMAAEVVQSYDGEPTGGEFALDHLLEYADVAVEAYRRDNEKWSE